LGYTQNKGGGRCEKSERVVTPSKTHERPEGPESAERGPFSLKGGGHPIGRNLGKYFLAAGERSGGEDGTIMKGGGDKTLCGGRS